jgi:glycosyltransferase involved in cell wall biosynthesis
MSYGSTDKLLQTMAKHLDPTRFEATLLYGGETGDGRRGYLEGSNVRLIRFTAKERQRTPPYTVVDMHPHINEVIDAFHIQCVVVIFWSDFQFPLTVIPSTVPVIGISPFGQWSSNGRVTRTYCSGPASVARARLAGSRTAEVFYNPLEGPPSELQQKRPIGDTIVFGRIGRPDDRIFDPIAVLAFDRLQREYGDRVRYDIVAPPPLMTRLVAELGTKNVRLLEPIDDEAALWRFYHDIDVLAHARLDGETLGVAIGEAMLAGNPVISHVSRYNNAHIELLLRPEFARWSAIDDVDGYYEHMRWFVEHAGDIRSMGAFARRKAESLFALPIVVTRVEADLVAAARKCSYWTPWGRIGGNVLVKPVAGYFAAKHTIRAAFYAALGNPRTRRWRVARRMADLLSLREYQRLARVDVSPDGDSAVS